MNFKNEEFWNTITHLIGLVLVLIGIPFLFYFDNAITSFSKASLVFFSIGLLLVYFSSTMYHYVSETKLKKKLQIFDHISIYYLILGSYAPVCLITLYNSSGVVIFLIVFLLAIIGTCLKLFFNTKIELMSLTLYLVMGWLIVFDINTLFELITFKAKILLISSGLSYTLGVFFYSFDRIKFFHSVWHIFVMTGSILHYLLILLYII
ncbi:MAG: hemolysin III family protein [Flavobacteriaceae bacterium]